MKKNDKNGQKRNIKTQKGGENKKQKTEGVEKPSTTTDKPKGKKIELPIKK